jgi:hypothetical protein
MITSRNYIVLNPHSEFLIAELLREQYCKNQTSNGLDITGLDKDEIKHREMDRVHRGTGRARSAGLEEILMMYVKGWMPFTQIVETAPSQVSTPNKIPSHAYISDTPNRLSHRHTYGFDSI